MDNLVEEGKSPFELFTQWLKEAEKSEPVDPNAMIVATADADGQPSARAILLKGHDERGFVFYTNQESNKGKQLAENSKAALLFYWKSLGRQIRIEGDVEHVSDREADEYFASRHRNSRIGAWASNQSRPMKDRSEFEARIKDYEAEFEGKDVPRPPHWSGYRVKPKRIEFWQAGEYRLHDRMVYVFKEDGSWIIERLYP
jgi:pyridoxamine 5'-phosphate oxidase